LHIMDELPTLVELISAPIEQMNQEQLTSHLARLREIRKKDFAQIAEDEALGRPEHRGFLYIFSNASMPGLVKIGITSGRVQERAKNLSSPTAVPEPYKEECFFPLYEDLRVVESRVHKVLDVFRVRSNREFFRIPARQAEQVIQELLGYEPRRIQIE